MTIRSCQSNNLTLSSLLFQKSKPQSIAGESSTNKEEKPPKPKVSWPALICFSKLIKEQLVFGNSLFIENENNFISKIFTISNY